MMNCMLIVFMGKVTRVRRLFMVVGRPLMVTGSVMVMLSSL